jgi:hypothetical protein
MSREFPGSPYITGASMHGASSIVSAGRCGGGPAVQRSEAAVAAVGGPSSYI